VSAAGAEAGSCGSPPPTDCLGLVLSTELTARMGRTVSPTASQGSTPSELPLVPAFPAPPSCQKGAETGTGDAKARGTTGSGRLSSPPWTPPSFEVGEIGGWRLMSTGGARSVRAGDDTAIPTSSASDVLASGDVSIAEGLRVLQPGPSRGDDVTDELARRLCDVPLVCRVACMPSELRRLGVTACVRPMASMPSELRREPAAATTWVSLRSRLLLLTAGTGPSPCPRAWVSLRLVLRAGEPLSNLGLEPIESRDDRAEVGEARFTGEVVPLSADGEGGPLLKRTAEPSRRTELLVRLRRVACPVPNIVAFMFLPSSRAFKAVSLTALHT
jgi:hypothetical protein